jgi:hypothetical protein
VWSGEALRWGGEKLYLRADADAAVRHRVLRTRNGPTGCAATAEPGAPAGVGGVEAALPVSREHYQANTA